MAIRVLVCGGRDYDNLEYMKIKLRELFDVDDTVTLIHGDANGADRLSEKALEGYFRGGFEVKRFPADWHDLSHRDALIRTRRDGTKYDARAGYRRNQKMLAEGSPAFVVAFPGGKGTADMVRQAKAAGIKVIKIE